MLWFFATVYKTNGILRILTHSKCTCWWTASSRMRSRIVFVMKTMKFTFVYNMTTWFWFPQPIHRQSSTKHRAIIAISQISITKTMVPRHTTKCRRPTPHWKRMYLYFVKLLKNQNVLNTLTRSTFAHAPNQALFKSISLVLVKLSILRNVL